jgi:hypothetical protein
MTVHLQMGSSLDHQYFVQIIANYFGESELVVGKIERVHNKNNRIEIARLIYENLDEDSRKEFILNQYKSICSYIEFEDKTFSDWMT